MTHPPFKAGQIYHNSDPNGAGWCKHGMVRIEDHGGTLIAVDTYWGDTSGYSKKPEEIEQHLTFAMDINECRFSHKEEFEIYADADRCYIPVGGGSEKFLIRKDADPDLERHRKWLNLQIDNCKSEIRYAERKISKLWEQLDSLGEAR